MPAADRANGEEPGPERSVVIPVHNRAPLTRACLDALLEHRPTRTEVIVVDDASGDGTSSTLASYGDAIRLIHNQEPLGFGGACNEGAARARGRYLAFLNNDTIPAPGWLDALVAHADSHPEAAIVGAKLLWPDGTVQHAGLAIGGDRTARHVYVGFPGDHPAVNRSRALQAVTAAAMLIRREAFSALGGFDLAFINGWEDVDLCLRAGEQGLGVRYCPEAVVFHLEGATRGREPDARSPNVQLYRERWAHRLRPDDLERYAEDGLLEARYLDDGNVEVRVSPEVGLPAHAGSPGDLEEALATRTRRALELRQENNDLYLAAHERPVRWRGVIARRAPAGDMTLSVVVPLGAHGHPAEILERLGDQTLSADRYRIVLADPLSGERDRPALEAALRSAREKVEVEYLETPRERGRAGALNRGIRRSEGDLVLMLADDFLPSGTFVEEHLAAHQADPRENVGGLGPAFFSESLRRDPFVRWLEDSGELFGTRFSADGAASDSFFYAANVSLKRSFLLGDELFDERLPLEAWDDYELGLRLVGRGLKIAYLPGAAVEHDHPLTLRERRKVMRKAGLSAATFDEIHPYPHRWTSGVDPSRSLLALGLGALAARLRHAFLRREEDRGARYHALLEREFLRGYRDAAWNGISVTDRVI